MAFLKYIGTAQDHTVKVQAENVSQIVTAHPGHVQHLDDAISSAVLAAEPSLWQPVPGF